MADKVELAAAWATPGADWDQGDVVEELYFFGTDERLPGILLTPACDIEQNKVHLWTFAALYPDLQIARTLVAKDLASWREKTPELSKRQHETLKNAMHNLITQRHPRYHWLPITIGESPAQVADFSCISTLPADEVRSKTRVASLRSSWREQVPARYTAFMSRVGTLDFKEDGLDRELERLVKAVAD